MKCCCITPKKEEKIQNTLVEICPNCGLITKKERISFLEERKRYDAHICDEGYKEYMQTIFTKIFPYIKGECLDYGCGKIHLLADLLNEHNFNASYYDLHYFPKLPKKTFDTIILVEVFEHLKEPYDELMKMKKMLNPKGRILILTKSYTESNLDTWWYFRDKTHISFIRKDTLTHWNLEMKLIDRKGDIFVLECI